MHELSIATSIFDVLIAEMNQRHLKTVAKVGLRIGALTNVDPESLRFGFEAISAGTQLEGSELMIEKVPIKAHCRKCGSQFEATDFVFICPNCSSSDNEVIQGQELDIVYIEGE